MRAIFEKSLCLSSEELTVTLKQSNLFSAQKHESCSELHKTSSGGNSGILLILAIVNNDHLCWWKIIPTDNFIFQFHQLFPSTYIRWTRGSFFLISFCYLYPLQHKGPPDLIILEKSRKFHLRLYMKKKKRSPSTMPSSGMAYKSESPTFQRWKIALFYRYREFGMPQ